MVLVEDSIPTITLCLGPAIRPDLVAAAREARRSRLVLQTRSLRWCWHRVAGCPEMILDYETLRMRLLGGANVPHPV